MHSNFRHNRAFVLVHMYARGANRLLILGIAVLFLSLTTRKVNQKGQQVQHFRRPCRENVLGYKHQ